MSESHEHKKFKIETDPPAPDFAKRAEIIREIKTLGFDEATAARFARLIGDRPTVEADGSIFVVEKGNILAKIKLAAFSSESTKAKL